MRVVLDNKSYHYVIATVEGRRYELKPRQIIYADVYNTEPMSITLEHRYVSYIDCNNDYIIVINTEYKLYGVTDGAILSIAYDRSKFSFHGVYERFFISFPLMYQCTERHTVTNFEEIYKPFRKLEKWDAWFDALGDIIIDLSYTLPFLGLAFIVAWATEGFKKALLVLVILFLVDIVGTFLFYVLWEKLFKKAEDSSRRRKRRKGRNVEEVVLKDLKGVCESEAITAYYADPNRTVIPEGSNYEG